MIKLKRLLFINLALISYSLYAKDIEKSLPTAIPGAAHFMKQHPKSDFNGDGILTHAEKEKYCIETISAQLGGDYTFERHMVPMRDGVKLATGIFVPKNAGPAPVILTRTAYGIWSAAFHNAHRFKGQNLVFICQDPRGDGESEGKGTFDAKSFDNEIEDGYDAIDWISKQAFCNGNVGIIGQSGHGFCGYMAYLAKHPALKTVSTNVSGGNAYLYWTYHNGVRREMYNWLQQRNTQTPQWPKPTITLFNKNTYAQTIKKASINNQTAFIAKTGWYDIFAESALDYFEAFADKGNLYIQVDASGHGNMAGRKPPMRAVPAKWQLPKLSKALTGSVTEKSKMIYFLMGDSTDPNAPGNEYKMTEVWPVPHKKVSYYMKSDGSLKTSLPTVKNAALSFKYDPRNPVPSIGGDVFIHTGVGPKDQRLNKDRKDILRFRSDVLQAPMEITGKVFAELFIKTDVEDTTFTANLIDIYPDGYEAIVRDSIIMGRFHEGFDKQSKLKKDKVYKLTMDMWSTAIVINKGHRLAVHISSSNSPKYEVHPNSYEPVMSFNESPVANNTIMLSKKYPSRIILPVVK
ncbi:CocE/NonD family hydrolase [Lentisphaera profundi]|uniref:CocE/NonD family hydrolase n=1 Tax=Lentisphaera profundi TaxID=1658616 RepID=A0ABY7VQG1_9BACT|nr:CocE/NonD family hydrolase [Lentisphaera profundi]WDE96423.1 CocE/NonD family hydrolase [Lentisphaera profundi]